MSQKNNKSDKSVEKKTSGLNPKQKNWLSTGLFLAVVAIFFIINNSGNGDESGSYPPGYNPNPIETLSLSDYKGKVVLIDFWATWCPPCRKGIPDLVELKEEYAKKDFEIIGISLDSFTRGGNTKNDVAPFMKSNKINYPIVEGLVKTTEDFGGIQSIPTSFIIDKEGNVIKKFEGLVTKKDYTKVINNALAGKTSPQQLAPIFELKVIK